MKNKSYNENNMNEDSINANYLSKFEKFELLSENLENRVLVEAAAGTGKTYSIALLVLRLLLEKEFSIDSILITTFTKAATAEIKDRIRKFVKTALEISKREISTTLPLSNPDDEPIENLLKNATQINPSLLEPSKITVGNRATELLDRALLAIDDAAIYTIHGFCQRVLDEFAFESRAAFDLDLADNQSELLTEIATDFLRENTHLHSSYWKERYPSPELFIEDLLSTIGWGTGKLTNFAQTLQNKPLAKIKGENCNELPTEVTLLASKMATLWETEQHLIKNTLIDCKLVGKNKATRFTETYWDDFYGKISEHLSNVQFFFINKPAQEDNPFWCLSPKALESFLLDKVLKKDPNAANDLPSHPFFHLCENFYDLTKDLDAGIPFLEDFERFFQRELKLRKNRLTTKTFSDLITDVYLSVQAEPDGELVRALRKKFKAALIDEFQDTDKQQFTIFETVFSYDKTPFFMIGDPKQSIYEFRGADIFAYQKGSEGSKRRVSMPTNYRSSAKLVSGVNEIFGSHPSPFVFDFIEYHPVDASPTSDETSLILEEEDDKGSKPIVMKLFQNCANEKELEEKAVAPFSKEGGLGYFFDDTANEIAKLVRCGKMGSAYFINNATGERKPVLPGSIAVLVPTNKDALLTKALLTEKNIPSVVFGENSIFQTEECNHFQTLLQAIAHPGRERFVRAALISPFYNYGGKEIRAMEENSQKRQEEIAKFENLNKVWQTEGFMKSVYLVLGNSETKKSILSSPGGARKMTNYLHLLEVLQSEYSKEPLSPAEMLGAISRKMGEEKNEEYEQRLDSDEKAVIIMTIHKSKGLEFPIVFCPNLTKAFRHDSLWLTPHVKVEDEYQQQIVLTKNFPQSVIDQALSESLAENCRLFYVATTRAAKRLYLYWGSFPETASVKKGSNRTVWQATAGNYFLSEASEKFKASENIAVELRFTANPLAEVPPLQEEPFTEQLQTRDFSTPIPKSTFLSSYSSLVTSENQGEIHSPLDSKDRDILETAQTESIAPNFENPVAEFVQVSASERYLTLPKGNKTGLMLHDLFETSDYQQTIDEGSLATIVEDWFPLHKERQGLIEECKQIYENTLSADLPFIGKLSEVAQKDRFNELGFYFSIDPLSLHSVNHLLNKYRTASFPLELLNSCAGVKPIMLEGCIQGFIDLIFKKGDRYYIADWKSNTLESYDKKNLSLSILHAGYDIQYLIYTIAVHRHLKSRIKGYQYETHFGGIFYIYLRGTNPGSSEGIFYERPSFEIIQELDTILSAEQTR